MKSITVHVTADDITKGVRRDLRYCPVAHAIHRAVGLDVEAGGLWLTFYSAPQDVPTPKPAWDFMRVFDNGEPVRPFDFTLELPDNFPLPTEVA